jgi:serine/threonine-protein kinase
LDTVLGRGAVGVVVGARHLLLDRPVAIKFMLGAASEQPESIARFVQEARSAARLKSAHVVKVFDVAVLDSGVPYIVMEYLEGTDLAAVLRRSGPVGVERAVDYILQACEAIAEAHDAGIVHRDVKPANLFLAARADGDPAIKVLDFGIAKSSPTLAPTTLDLATADAIVRMTLPRSIMGSPLYMSPEQMESSGDVDARTDIWALGVTLFELVTGRVPFSGTSIVQVYSQMLAKETAWLEHLPADTPRELRSIIGRCLRRDRSDRYTTVRELSRSLALVAPSAPLDRTQISPTPALAPDPVSPPRSRRLGAGSMVGIVALGVGVAVTGLVVSRRAFPTLPARSGVHSLETAVSPVPHDDRHADSLLAASPPVEVLDPIALVPPPATERPGPSLPAAIPRGRPPPGSSTRLDARATVPTTGPTSSASSVASDASTSAGFNVDEMLKARE